MHRLRICSLIRLASASIWELWDGNGTPFDSLILIQVFHFWPQSSSTFRLGDGRHEEEIGGKLAKQLLRLIGHGIRFDDLAQGSDSPMQSDGDLSPTRCWIPVSAAIVLRPRVLAPSTFPHKCQPVADADAGWETRGWNNGDIGLCENLIAIWSFATVIYLYLWALRVAGAPQPPASAAGVSQQATMIVFSFKIS